MARIRLQAQVCSLRLSKKLGVPVCSFVLLFVRKTPSNSKAASACCLHLVTLVAKASTTEEPDAGKPQVRLCGGASGNGRSYSVRFREDVPMRKSICCLMLLVLVKTADPSSLSSAFAGEDLTIRVLTQNVRHHNCKDANKGRGWLQRREFVLNEILSANADVVGVQELNKKKDACYDSIEHPKYWMRKKMEYNGYAVIKGVGDSPKDIYFKKSRIQRTSKTGATYLWPDSRRSEKYCPPAKNSDVIGRTRSATWAILCLSDCDDDNFKFLIINTHFHHGNKREVKKARQKQAECIRNLANTESYIDKDLVLPIVVMGDLNANSGDKEINTLLAELPNGSILKDSTSDELGGTYNKWGAAENVESITYYHPAGELT